MTAKLYLLFFLSVFSCSGNKKEETKDAEKDYTATHAEALNFCKEKGFCEDYYFLVDMSIHSGRNRFFVYSFKDTIVTDKNIVTHGSCDKFEDNPYKYQTAKFSNTPDSHCSSKGKYRIGNRDYSSWGINVKYWLHGLEETNNNAVDRVVVLHSWDAVSNREIYPQYSPLSWGCPAVSDKFMKKLDEKLKQTAKPVLLWIIE